MKPPTFYAHLPFSRVATDLEFVLERSLGAEIAFKGWDFDGVAAEELENLGEQLRQAECPVTVHAPFMDLNPGAPDPLIQHVTATRLEQTLAAASRLGAKLVVVHPGYERWRYAGNVALWLEHNRAFWPPLLEKAARLGCRIALENVFDESPDHLLQLLEELDSPWLGHCFDVGHWNLFCRAQHPLASWLSLFGARTYHLHLHDNFGDRDAHLPVGAGNVPFSELLALQKKACPAASMTLEAHSREDLVASLAALRELSA